MTPIIIFTIAVSLVIIVLIIMIVVLSRSEAKAMQIARQSVITARELEDQITKAGHIIDRQAEAAKRTEDINNEQVKKIMETSTGTDSDKFDSSISILSNYSANRDRDGD